LRRRGARRRLQRVIAELREKASLPNGGSDSASRKRLAGRRSDGSRLTSAERSLPTEVALG
jgi:hypothetical protein